MDERGADAEFVHERWKGDVHGGFNNHAAEGHDACGDYGEEQACIEHAGCGVSHVPAPRFRSLWAQYPLALAYART